MDNDYKEANTFEFSPNANIITARLNTQGKSCLLKSIYYTLGLDIRTFKPDWQQKKKMFKLYYEHNNKQGTIIRYNNRIWVDENPQSLNLKEYSKWLSTLLGLEIKLNEKETNEYVDVYPSVYSLPFYVDQDNSWAGAIYRNVAMELGQYNSAYIPKSLFEYMFKMSNEEIMRKEDEKQEYSTEKGVLTTRKNAIQELKDKFILETEPISFNEEEAKEHIQRYLHYAQKISKKIQESKNEIYNEEIKLDKLRLELAELSEILDSINSEYKNIKTKCKYCNAELAIEQSIQRLKLSNNYYDIGLRKEKLKQDIQKREATINRLLYEKLGLENDYNDLMKIAEIKQKEYTLNDYIENKAKSITKDNYYKVEDRLNLDISKLDDKINRIQKEIRELKNAQKSLTENISETFEDLKTYLNAQFPSVYMEQHSFMDFKVINNSGATKNAEYFMLYMIYLNLLIEYSIVKMPFGLDSVIKDEVDEDNKNKFYELIEKYILSSSEQSFVVMLDDKIKLLKSPQKYHFVGLARPILDRNKYNSLMDEFKVILK